MLRRLTRFLRGSGRSSSSSDGHDGQQTQPQSRPLSTSTAAAVSPSRHNRRPNLRTIAGHLRQVLLDLPRAVTVNLEMADLDTLGEMAEQNESDLRDIVLAMVETMPIANPLAPALINIVLDILPVPAMATIRELATLLYEEFSAEDASLEERRNILVIWSALAVRFPGHTAETLLLPKVVDTLIAIMRDDQHPLITLHALLTVEMFCKTRKTKEQLIAARAPQVIADLERRYCRLTDATNSSNATVAAGAAASAAASAAVSAAAASALPEDTTAAAKKPARSLAARVYAELINAQVGFCSMWLLDNVLPQPGRVYTIDRTDTALINVMLDVKDATSELKLAPDGLEARNDGVCFESVKATCSATGDSGTWFYEVLLFTAGIMQVGWATNQCVYQTEEGHGIGDDEHSLAYDGCRQLLWYNKQTVRHRHPPWKPGDVLGCYLDLDKRLVNFSLNGVMLTWASLPIPPGQGLYPAASLMTYQHLQFNFGNAPYRFPPKEPFHSLSQIGHLTLQQRHILPRLLVLSRLQEEQAEGSGDDDGPVCSICYVARPEVVHRPCGHQEFCMICSLQCDTCPLCRAPIDDRDPLENEAANRPTTALEGLGVACTVEEPAVDGIVEDEQEDGDAAGEGVTEAAAASAATARSTDGIEGENAAKAAGGHGTNGAIEDAGDDDGDWEDIDEGSGEGTDRRGAPIFYV